MPQVVPPAIPESSPNQPTWVDNRRLPRLLGQESASPNPDAANKSHFLAPSHDQLTAVNKSHASLAPSHDQLTVKSKEVGTMEYLALCCGLRVSKELCESDMVLDLRRQLFAVEAALQAAAAQGGNPALEAMLREEVEALRMKLPAKQRHCF